MANTMLFGPLGRQVAIPYPLSGMSLAGESAVEATDLISGGVSVYRAPTSHKTYNMSFSGGVLGLQPLVDMHAGVYGRGPFYMTDPMAVNTNLLPTRWASPWQLAYVANGWSDPVLGSQFTTPEGQFSQFRGNVNDTDEGMAIAIPVVPSKPLYLKVWGTRTTTAAVRAYRLVKATGLWELAATHVPSLADTGATTLHTTANAGLYHAYKLVLYAPTGATLSLYHIDLSTTTYTAGAFRSGQGVGALQFTGNIAGNLTGTVVDKIGLSIDLKEVERDANL